MRSICLPLLAALAACATVPKTPAAAPPPAITSSKVAAFAWMDGRWRGKATVLNEKGRIELVQAERIGPLLGGDVRLVEGRGYEADGSLHFNALGVIFQKADGSYAMHSWAQGRESVFAIVPRGQGYVWEIPAGPKAKIRYTATFAGGVWTEIGELIVEGRPPVENFRMDLTRVDDTDWPAAGALGPR